MSFSSDAFKIVMSDVDYLAYQVFLFSHGDTGIIEFGRVGGDGHLSLRNFLDASLFLPSRVVIFTSKMSVS